MSSILKVSTLQDPTNSNTALQIDTSGIITTPQRPAFRAYGTSGTWTSFGITKVTTLTTADYNIGSHYNTTDCEFTAPIDGLYHIHGHFYVNNTSTLSGFYIMVDGTAYSNTYFASQENTAGDNTVAFSETLQLSANQVVAMRGNSGEYFPLYSSFGGYLVG